MNYTTLPNTELKVSKICLGTMTFGNQNTESEAHSQLDFAVENGINFIDTAEMYPIGGNAQIFGSTERFMGTWIQKIGPSEREKLVIATKIAGPNRGMEYIRQPLDFSRKSLHEAVELSLKNLQTDYIDLYQLHWPNRVSPHFGKHRTGRIAFSNVDAAEQTEQMLGLLQALDKLISNKAQKSYDSEKVWLVIRNAHPDWHAEELEQTPHLLQIPPKHPFEQIWLIGDMQGQSGILALYPPTLTALEHG